MRFACLGSGSNGNALVVEVKQTRIMLDCGFGITETKTRLARLGLEPEQLSAILVTHEHDDHIGGVARFAKKYNVPVWLTYGTAKAAFNTESCPFSTFIVDGYRRFAVGDIEVEPYPVPHDAREPAQYVFSDGAKRLGVLTDTGCLTPHIQKMLDQCDALMLECNHDLEMLRNSNYPFTLQQRIAGKFGHLDNGTSANILASIDCTRLQHVIAAHLSKQNNTPELAQKSLSGPLNCELDWVGIADQEQGFAWRQIS